MLLQWIRHYISVFEESKFPTSYKEIEGAVQAGQIMVPPSYNPIDVEKEWRQLHEAIIKRERLLRNEFERVYRFHEHLVNLYNNRVPFTHPELHEVMLYYIQDLLAWVEKNQRCIHNSEWGADLPSIKSHMGSHHGLHESIKDFKSNIEHARADEKSSKAQLNNLNTLYTFAVAATEELMWLSERMEEELKYDWSANNTNMTAKKDNYSSLEWDLEQRKISVNTVLANGDKLLKDGHPAQSTIEASHPISITCV
ncbi:hypothetical protein PDJAM_G00200370 [Pangasius djambal]|uniref:Uncharacterized protein n=1 Tax=Pangasius djambal TaxID=1691987 RepID=A0ACC5Y7K5_9TELE|nr:hypothetical protein [Pangasius djambal]